MVRRGLPALLFILLLPLAASSGDPEWGTSDPTATGPSPRCVIFYEGKNCDPTQGRSSCCTEAGAEMAGCWENDEARSMKIYGGPDTVITAFDDPKGGTHDDYFVLQKQAEAWTIIYRWSGQLAPLEEQRDETELKRLVEPGDYALVGALYNPCEERYDTEMTAYRLRDDGRVVPLK